MWQSEESMIHLHVYICTLYILYETAKLYRLQYCIDMWYAYVYIVYIFYAHILYLYIHSHLYSMFICCSVVAKRVSQPNFEFVQASRSESKTWMRSMHWLCTSMDAELFLNGTNFCCRCTFAHKFLGFYMLQFRYHFTLIYGGVVLRMGVIWCETVCFRFEVCL